MNVRESLKNRAALFGVDFLFAKFVLVGVVNTVFGYLAYAFFVWLGGGDFTAPLFATVCGVLFNFKTTGNLVFGNSSNRLLLRFFAVYLFTYVLTVALLKILAFAGLENRYVSGAFILAPMALISFFLNKDFVFKTEK